MLKLNTDEIRNLQFEVSIQGINYDELQGSLKFIIEDVEYGIPVKIQRDLVSVEVPPLEEIVAQGMKNGDIVECKLDIFGNGFYINPWGGQFELAIPAKVEATQFNIDNRQPGKNVVEESTQSLDKEAILEMLFEKLEERGFKTPDQSQLNILEEEQHIETKKIKPLLESKSTPTKKQLVEMKIKNKFKHVDNLIKSLTEGKKIIKTVTTPKQIVKEDRVISAPQKRTSGTELSDIMDKVQQLKSGKKMIPQERIENNVVIDNNDPTFLMESVGMKNPKIQKIMLEKAIELGGDGEKGMTDALKKLLGIGQANPYDHMVN